MENINGTTEPVVSRVVSSHAVAVHAHSSSGIDVSARIQQAMENAIHTANREGISNSEQDAPVMRARMQRAQRLEMIAITKENYAWQVVESSKTHQSRLAELQRAHTEHLSALETAYQAELQSLEQALEKGV